MVVVMAFPVPEKVEADDTGQSVYGRIVFCNRRRSLAWRGVVDRLVLSCDLAGTDTDVEVIFQLAAVVRQVRSHAVDQPPVRRFLDVERFAVDGVERCFDR